MSKRQTKEQERAAYAWQCVENVFEVARRLGEKEADELRKKGKSADEAREKGEAKKRSFENDYGSQARGLPALIQTNGPGQTLAYLLAKGKYKDAVKKENPHHLLYSHLSRWIMKEIWQVEDIDNLLVKLTQESSANYRRATSEAMALLVWLRRFAEARLVKEEVSDGGTS
jgi:CRISPR-associated protein Cmr5